MIMWSNYFSHISATWSTSTAFDTAKSGSSNCTPSTNKSPERSTPTEVTVTRCPPFPRKSCFPCPLFRWRNGGRPLNSTCNGSPRIPGSWIAWPSTDFSWRLNRKCWRSRRRNVTWTSFSWMNRKSLSGPKPILRQKKFWRSVN